MSPRFDMNDFRALGVRSAAVEIGPTISIIDLHLALTEDAHAAFVDAVGAVVNDPRQPELSIEIAELRCLAIPLGGLQHILALALLAILESARDGELRFVVARLCQLFLLLETQGI